MTQTTDLRACQQNAGDYSRKTVWLVAIASISLPTSVLVPTSVLAQQVSSYGIGSIDGSCQMLNVVAPSAKDVRDRYEQWIMGAWSALDQADSAERPTAVNSGHVGASVGNGLTIIKAVKEECIQHPNVSIEDATMPVFMRMRNAGQ